MSIIACLSVFNINTNFYMANVALEMLCRQCTGVVTSILASFPIILHTKLASLDVTIPVYLKKLIRNLIASIYYQY